MQQSHLVLMVGGPPPPSKCSPKHPHLLKELESATLALSIKALRHLRSLFPLLLTLENPRSDPPLLL